MHRDPPTARTWTVVMPVKGGAAAKSRLSLPGAGGSLDGDTAARLATAMAADCLEAVLAAARVARVLVVTGDPVVAGTATTLGAVVVHQPAADPGLTAAVALGVREAAGPTAVLLADLPALTSQDVDAVLRAADAACRGGRRWVFVPDAGGTGTVLIAAIDAAELRPAFGPGSAAAHRVAGAHPLTVDLPRLRRDVDTADDLAAALALGVGPRTARTLADVQATVLSWSTADGSGEVVTDAGVRLPMAPDALVGSGLRHLRPGQRVTCTVARPAAPARGALTADGDAQPAEEAAVAAGTTSPSAGRPSVSSVRIHGIAD